MYSMCMCVVGGYSVDRGYSVYSMCICVDRIYSVYSICICMC